MLENSAVVLKIFDTLLMGVGKMSYWSLPGIVSARFRVDICWALMKASSILITCIQDPPSQPPLLMGVIIYTSRDIISSK